MVVILDDFQLIDDAFVLDSLDLFRDECPSVQLVLAGRHDPRLPVSRLRLKGELAEIREADLRFTLDETRELTDASGISLPDESIRQLWERIEGWPAAARLATLSLANATDPVGAIVAELHRPATGSHRVSRVFGTESAISAASLCCAYVAWRWGRRTLKRVKPPPWF
jgi:ATP/maltotriose-dependent transcriptional regulator MalT